jgi:hypothetical protein
MLVLRLVWMTQGGQRATWKPSFDAKPWPASTVMSWCCVSIDPVRELFGFGEIDAVIWEGESIGVGLA